MYNSIQIASFYYFINIKNLEENKKILLMQMKKLNIKGTIIISKEGINSSISGNKINVMNFIEYMKNNFNLPNDIFKYSFYHQDPFNKSKVKIKKEIVSMGIDNIQTKKNSNSYISIYKWNNLIQDKNIFLLDVRNKYEIKIGTFNKSFNPNINTFREFPDFVINNLSFLKEKKIAMFCTGGIRCEKAVELLKLYQIYDVFQLKGGIISYLKYINQNESLWNGECFVFDSRVSLNHKLEKGNYDQCFACRNPITEIDKENNFYQKGISCKLCFDKK